VIYSEKRATKVVEKYGSPLMNDYSRDKNTFLLTEQDSVALLRTVT
jgi:hypothetical protein